MNALVQPAAVAAPAERSALATFAELFKARLNLLVLLTTLVGYYAGARGRIDLGLLLHTLLGTGLLAAGAAALNQLLERDRDALMERTRDRPLPAGRVTPVRALWLGGACALAGLFELTAAVGWLTGLLGFATLALYLLVYTPLKRLTTLNTVVGAIPGALPPLIGWSAATGEVSVGGWSLFVLQFVWQLPHFLAIAWLYRADYARAGFKMLPVVDPTGELTAHRAAQHALGLLAVSLAPFLAGVAGRVYLVGALLLGAGFLALAIAFARTLARPRARALFLGSIIYLPLVLGLIVLDKAR